MMGEGDGESQRPGAIITPDVKRKKMVLVAITIHTEV